MKTYPRITHVAIRYRGTTYSLPPPNRHHNVIRLIAETLGIKYVDARDDDQGFLDENGQYLRRKPALRVASANNQLREGVPVIGGRLYSENLW